MFYCFDDVGIKLLLTSPQLGYRKSAYKRGRGNSVFESVALCIVERTALQRHIYSFLKHSAVQKLNVWSCNLFLMYFAPNNWMFVFQGRFWGYRGVFGMEETFLSDYFFSIFIVWLDKRFNCIKRSFFFYLFINSFLQKWKEISFPSLILNIFVSILT